MLLWWLWWWRWFCCRGRGLSCFFFLLDAEHALLPYLSASHPPAIPLLRLVENGAAAAFQYPGAPWIIYSPPPLPSCDPLPLWPPHLLWRFVGFFSWRAMCVQDIFRKYPNRYESIISALCENLDTLDEPEAKVSARVPSSLSAFRWYGTVVGSRRGHQVYRHQVYRQG